MYPKSVRIIIFPNMEVIINWFNGVNIKIIIRTIDMTVHMHTCLVAFEYSITKLFDIYLTVLI